MLRKLWPQLWLLVVAATALVQAVYDPVYSGIKTKTYRRDPQNGQVFDHYAQGERTYSSTYQAPSLEATAPRLSTYQHYGIASTQSQPDYQHPYQRPVDQHAQRELPLYQRNSHSAATGHSIDDGRHVSENTITDYYTGCPPQHTGPVPYAYDCRRFVNCWHGRGHIQSCGPGTVFNPQTLECDRPDKVVCGTLSALGAQHSPPPVATAKYRVGRLQGSDTENVNVLCPAGVTGLQPHPTDCTKFLNCANGNVHIQNCGPGTAFSASMQVCDFKDRVDCSGRDGRDGRVLGANGAAHGQSDRTSESAGKVTCPAGASGLYPHPLDCTKFLNCAHGQAVVQSCGPGTAYDRFNMVCDYPEKVDCAGASLLSSTKQQGEHRSFEADLPAGEEEPGNIFCPIDVTGLFAYPFDYTRFLNCKQGNTAIQNCMAGTVFSISRGYCDLRENVLFTDRVTYIVSEVSYEYSYNVATCPPSTDGLHLYPFDGSKYVQCSEGVMIILHCPTDSVFSISRRKCLPRRQVSATDRVKYMRDIVHQTVTKTSGTAMSQNYADKMVQCPTGHTQSTAAFPHPFDCTKYLKCVNGKLVIEICASGSVFSLSRKRCDQRRDVADNDKVQFQVDFSQEWNYDYSNYDQGTVYLVCPPNVNGFFLHPFDCTKYLICHNGQTKVEDCTAGHAFSISRRRCVMRDQVEAYDRVEYLTESQHEFSAETDTLRNHASSAVSCPNGAVGLYPHPHDCTKYLKCSNGHMTIESCTPGEVFSASKRYCDYKERIHDYDRVDYEHHSTANAAGVGTRHETTLAAFGSTGEDAGEEVSCPPRAEGMYPHPADCSKFLTCSNGVTYIKDCGPGTAWSRELEVCDFIDKVDCGSRKLSARASTLSSKSTSRVSCPPGASGFYPHPFDMAKYFSCVNGETTIESCSEGTIYSTPRRMCLPRRAVLGANREVDARQFVTVTTTQHMSYIICPPQANGIFVYPFDCAKYIRCDSGRTSIEGCAPGSVYSLSAQRCVLRDQVERNDRVDFGRELQHNSGWQSGHGQVTTSSTSFATQGQGVECPRHVNGLQPHPFDCKKFMNCANGITHIQDCGPGTAWDIEAQVCDYEHKVDCSSRLVGGREGKAYGSSSQGRGNSPVTCPVGASGLHPHPFDCTKFLNCADGVTHIQSCGPGTAWNAKMEVCDLKDNVNCDDRNGLSPTTDYGSRGSSAHSYGASHNTQWGREQPNTNAGTWQQGQYGSNPQPTANHHNNGQVYNSQDRTSTIGATGYRDRWSNMDVQRPVATTYGQGGQHSAPSYAGSNDDWSGYGSAFDRQTPIQSVVYAEGSLEPNRNYHSAKTYSAPLAPLSPNTVASATTRTNPTTASNTANTHPNAGTNVYYAQPVGSEEDSKETFNSPVGADQQAAHSRRTSVVASENALSNRQNHGREIGYSGSPANNWIPVPNQNLMPPYPNVEQDPVPTQPNSLTIETPKTHLMPPVQSVLDVGQRPLEEAYAPAFTADASNLYGGMQPPPPPGTPLSSTPIEMPKTHLMPPVQSVLDVDQRPLEEVYAPAFTADASNLYGGMQPPPPPGTPLSSTPIYSAPYDPQPKTEQTSPAPNLMPPLGPLPSGTSQRLPENSFTPRPLIDASNLYGGMQPPLPSSPQLQPSPPLTTTPSYYTRVKTPSSYLRPPTYPTAPVPPSSPATTRLTKIHTVPTYPLLSNATQAKSFRDPHYSPSYSSVVHAHNATWSNAIRPVDGVKTSYRPRDDATSDGRSTDELAISDALRMLLRPYFNRSGTVSEDAASQAESHIMKLIPTPTAYGTNTYSHDRSATEIASSGAIEKSEKDVELILAGEQHSLTTNPIQNGTRETRTEFYSHQQKQTEESSNRHNHGHSRDFHLRHPNLPNPFVGDQRSSASPSATSSGGTYSHHTGSHHQDPHSQHGREFHLRHPDVPNPYGTTEPSASNPYGGIDPRSDCEFDCGNNKCVKSYEVCNGVNDCGNRKDESHCEHLGYHLRLTGSDSPNKGRIEVKILGKWGYVCDDKFGMHDADVVCRELGFDMGASEVRGNSAYPPSGLDVSFAMDEVDCLGNETSLKECNFNGWSISDCGPDEVVGVVCKVPLLKCPNNYWLCSTSKECIPPAFVCDNTPDCADQSDESDRVCNSPITYRLEGGRSKSEGRLEIKYRSEWGTVCDDDFGMREAQVACNSLGFYGKPKIERNVFGPGSGPIWLDQVSCLGNETSIDRCNHWSWGEHNCNHTEDVGLKCTAGSPTQVSKQFDEDNNNQEQLLEDSESMFDDIGLYSRLTERSSKSLNNAHRSCGHFNDSMFDEYEHPEERVVNGSIAKRGRYPWQATIRTRGRGGISSHWCGAVLISKWHLLTAAHCLAGYPKGAYFVRMGDHYANIAESSEIDAYIENWYVHEKFRDKTHMNNDIALLVLKSPVRFNDYVQPVCLPQKDTPLEENRICTISGWGSIKSGVSTPSNVLRAANLPILSDDTCQQPHVYGASLTEGMFCAGFMDESVDACDGDSGGPLICSDGDGETLYGIISWGQHCGYANKPGVYVRVEKYIDWILDKIKFSAQRHYF